MSGPTLESDSLGPLSSLIVYLKNSYKKDTALVVLIARETASGGFPYLVEIIQELDSLIIKIVLIVIDYTKQEKLLK